MRVLDRLIGAFPARLPGQGLDGATLFVGTSREPIPVLVTVRPSAQRMILRIDRRSGGARLTLPRGVGRVRAERFLATYSGWLCTKLAALPRHIPFEDGASLPLRGQMCRIEHRAPFRGETRIETGENELLLIVHGDKAHLSGRVSRFLRALALADITAAVGRRAGEMGVDFGRISVKDTQSRWGSCSARGDLSFSWRLILAPPFVLDYLAVHELAHRLEMNHSPRYWRHVRRICPEFETAEAWLKRNGPALHHYG